MKIRFRYQNLSRRAEKFILAEQIRYQQALKEFAKTLVAMKNKEELASAILSRLVSLLNLTFGGFYLKGGDAKFKLVHAGYGLQVAGYEGKAFLPPIIGDSDSFVNALKKEKSPLPAENLPKLEKLEPGLVIPRNLDACFRVRVYGRNKNAGD